MIFIGSVKCNLIHFAGPLKYKYGNRHFWAEGYYVSTVGLNEATIRKYIQEQEKQDIMKDKLSVKEYEAPLIGASKPCLLGVVKIG